MFFRLFSALPSLPLFCSPLFLREKQTHLLRRILVVQLGNIKEVVHSIPLLAAVKTRFPQTETAWLVHEKSASVLFDHWAVNRLIIVRSDWLKSLQTMREIRQRLRLFAPDAAIVPQRTAAGAFAAWISGAKYRIGFRSRYAGWLHNVRITAEMLHPVEQNMCLLQPLGIAGCSVDFDLPEYSIDRRSAKNILARKKLSGNFALVYVGSAHLSARWTPEKFGQTAKYLLEQWNLPSLFVWSAFEEDLAEAAACASGGAGISAPYTTLAEKTSLARLATIFIGADTPELQLAAAAGTRSIGLFGLAAAAAGMPYGFGNRAVQADLPAAGYAAGRIESITPETVCSVCDDVLTDILHPPVLPLPKPGLRKRKMAA